MVGDKLYSFVFVCLTIESLLMLTIESLILMLMLNRPHRLMKTSSIAVETSRSTSSVSIVEQTNKVHFLSYNTMNNTLCGVLKLCLS